MTHRREPGSLADAITRVVADLGGDHACAETTGIAKALLQAWKNPGRDAWPSIQQAITLDRAWSAANPDQFPPPIIEAMQLKLIGDGTYRPDLPLVSEMARVSEDVGRVLTFALEEVRLHGPGGSITPSPEKRIALLHSVSSAICRLARVYRALDSREALQDPMVRFCLRPSESTLSEGAVIAPPKGSVLRRMFGR